MQKSFLKSTKYVAALLIVAAIITGCKTPPEEEILLDGTVSFDGNGNTDGTVPDPKTASYGSSIFLPGPGSMSRTDFSFIGWNTSPWGSGGRYVEGDSYTVNGDTTLYARWVKNAATMPNPIKNPSVEIPLNSTTPENWSFNFWSDPPSGIVATSSYLNEGHTGSRSVKVEITAYNATIGDAKWAFDHVELVPGNDYIFSNYYKSNVDSKVTVEYLTVRGSYAYFDLPSAPPSANWTKYEATFTLPGNAMAGVANARVYHLLSQVGWLITDDYQLDMHNYEGFAYGMVTLTFDDAWELNTETALPIMQQHGFKSTQYYMAEPIMHPWPGLNPKTIIQRFIDAGHEIGSHSLTHPWLTQETEAKVIQELSGSKAYLNYMLGVDIRHFASPFGDYNAFVKDKIMEYYETHTTVEEGYNSKDNLDLSRLKRISVLSTTTAAEVKEWVEKARDENLWLILLYHMVTDEPYGSNIYDHTSVALFAAQMQAIKDSGIQVKTISEALDEIMSR